jgi:predicted nucleic acid-binding protein
MASSSPRDRDRRETRTSSRRRHAIPIDDSLIAATTPVHGLTVIMRNRPDYAEARLGMIAPFAL